nr:5-formyltetrahydrofolate cyclo-ligase [Candidatus Njordarchaeota archaeon]
MKNNDTVRRQKQDIRRRVWSQMELANVTRFPKPVYGRIPNFVGAEIAARKLCAMEVFRKARTVFCCPDSPQRPVRLNVLKESKTLVMASPRLREDFILLDPTSIDSKQYVEASTITGAFKYGKRIGPSDLRVDFKVTGSVAVTLEGGRVGKGGGYSDLEYGLLREFNCITEETPIATTVHDLQVVVWVPMDPTHDMPVNLICTPTRIVETRTKTPKPKGIDWSLLSEKQVEKIPLLAELRNQSAS